MRLKEGFRDSVNALNEQIVSPSQLSLPYGHGRAYSIDGGSSYYGDEIHTQAVGEGHKNRIQAISKEASLKGGVFAGAAGFINLSYMGAAESSAGILYDLNAHQKIFWDELLDVMAKCSSLDGFQSEMLSMLKNVQFKINALEACEDIKTVGRFTKMNELREKMGPFFTDDIPQPYPTKLRGFYSEPLFMDWMMGESELGDLAWKDHYTHLHEMAKAGAIGAMTLDICDREAAEQLEDFLEEKVIVFYLSNIFRFLERERDFSGRQNDVGLADITQAEKNSSRLTVRDKGVIIGDYFCKDKHHQPVQSQSLSEANAQDAKFSIS